MANTAMTPPKLLTDPGFLYWAPLASSVPTNTVAGSVFTDTWPVAWIALGMTEAGSTLTYGITVEPIEAAETFDPLSYRTTGRTASAEFQLKNFSATNLARAMNTAATVVSGTGATQLNRVTPPSPGAEVRAMLGWESLDSTVRWVGYQFINSGDLAIAMQKAPATGNIPFTANFEKTSGNQPIDFWTAGSTRG